MLNAERGAAALIQHLSFGIQHFRPSLAAQGSTDMATDPRFLTASGREVFTGNELLVKGALEAEGGVHLITGYPGSPVGAFFDVLGDIKDLLGQNGVRAFQANNEALGAAAVNGSQMVPCR